MRQFFQIVQGGAAPTINRLIVIAHGGKARTLAHQMFQHFVLRGVGVLVFVHQHMAELGFADFVPAVWYGFVVPEKTPKETIDRLYHAFAKAANDQGLREKLGRLGLTVQVRSAADFGRLMREETKRWGQVVRENNIKME